MKILWITKVFSESYTGGTKVSYSYIKDLNKSNEVTVHSLVSINGNQTKRCSLISFFYNLLKLRRQEFDVVVFDDHFSYLSILFQKKKTFSFYHGNWPTLFTSGFVYFIKGLYFFPLHLIGMLFSNKTIFVNPYYQRIFRPFCREGITLLNPVALVKNKRLEKNGASNKFLNFLLVGNVDERKYQNLLNFLIWNHRESRYSNLSFSVFGRIEDESLAKKLRAFGVNLLGFAETIPYFEYDGLVSFSRAENLPLSMFEALRNGVPCFYPYLKNYLDFKDKDGIYLYKDFSELLGLFNNSLNSKIDDSFIPSSCEENLRLLFANN